MIAPTELRRRTVVLGTALAVTFFIFMIGLGVRSFTAHDARFGFRTFSVNVQYEVDYHWRLASGRRVDFVPGDELRGVAWDELHPGRHVTNYDVGEMRSAVCGYAEYVFTNRRFEGAEAFEATVAYRENGVGLGTVKQFVFPPVDEKRCG